MIGGDSYSLGYNIAKAYLEDSVALIEQDGQEYPSEIFNGYGFFPIIAPSYYKEDLLFLIGMSDAFGFPVTIISSEYELEKVFERLGGAERFTHMLCINLNYLDYMRIIEFYDLDTSGWLFFGYNYYLDSLIYQSEYLYKISSIYNEDIGYKLENWLNGGEELDYNEWIFDAASRWYELGYNPDDNQRDDYIMYWENLCYYFDYDEWTTYSTNYWLLVECPDWQTYWDTFHCCLVAQEVIRL